MTFFALQLISSLGQILYVNYDFKGSAPAEKALFIVSTTSKYDLIEIGFALGAIYMFVLYARFIEMIFKRYDPFSNALILALLIFVVGIQKYLVDLVGQ